MESEFFTDLYNQNFEYVYSYVFARTTGNSQLTEEIVQETFSSAWLSLCRFNKKSSYRTWLCSIAKNKLRESYRKAIYKEKLEIPDNSSIDEQSDDISLEEIVLSNETRLKVLKVLEEMSSLYRYLLIMKYMDGMHVKESSASTLINITLERSCYFRVRDCSFDIFLRKQKQVLYQFGYW